jgi:protoheme IX farnesyltransferase
MLHRGQAIRRYSSLLAALFLVSAPFVVPSSAPGRVNAPGVSDFLPLLLGMMTLVAALYSWPITWGDVRTTNARDVLPAFVPLWLTLSLALIGLRFANPDSTSLRIYHFVILLPGLASAYLAMLNRADGSPAARSSGERATWRDYLMLTKPIVVSLLLVTTLAAMIVGAGRFPPLGEFLWTALGGLLSAGGASALNQYIDRVRDGQMQRTSRRPLPAGRISGPKAVAFGLLLCMAGLNVLALGVNVLSAFMAFIGMLYYVLLYSVLLKPTTPQNIVIGGGAGAIPPLVGWAAATNTLTMPAFFLFALIFFWTPPHFWALALLKNKEYARAGVPMFPVVYGEQETRVHILLYALQLVAFTVLMPLADLGSSLFLGVALLLGAGFLGYAWRLWRYGTNKLAWSMYRYSSTYLAMIFITLVVDTLVTA